MRNNGPRKGCDDEVVDKEPDRRVKVGGEANRRARSPPLMDRGMDAHTQTKAIRNTVLQGKEEKGGEDGERLGDERERESC